MIERTWKTFFILIYPSNHAHPPSTIIINKITMEGKRTMRNTSVGEVRAEQHHQQARRNVTLTLRNKSDNLKSVKMWVIYVLPGRMILSRCHETFFPFPNCSFVVGCHKPSEQFPNQPEIDSKKKKKKKKESDALQTWAVPGRQAALWWGLLEEEGGWNGNFFLLYLFKTISFRKFNLFRGIF